MKIHFTGFGVYRVLAGLVLGEEHQRVSNHYVSIRFSIKRRSGWLLRPNGFSFASKTKYSLPQGNSLRLVVDEAVRKPSVANRADPLGHLPELTEILKDAEAIETTQSCRTFELTWKLYVAYLVTEECVGSCGKYDDETFGGNLFRIYTKSHFLDHLGRDTGGHTEAIRHYKLICLNHLIDVAAYAPPEVRQIGPISSAPTQIQ